VRGSGDPLPEGRGSVGVESGIARHTDEAFELRLSDQHAIEGVVVVRRQRGSGRRVRRPHRELIESAPSPPAPVARP